MKNCAVCGDIGLLDERRTSYSVEGIPYTRSEWRVVCQNAECVLTTGWQLSSRLAKKRWQHLAKVFKGEQ